MEIKAKNKIIEVFKVEYKDIHVDIKINYKNQTISFVESDGHRYKRWLFSERGLEYMESWNDILDAMKKAIEIGEGRLKEYVNHKNDEN